MTKLSSVGVITVILLAAGGFWWGSAKALTRWKELHLEVSMLKSEEQSLQSNVSLLKSDIDFEKTLRKPDEEIRKMDRERVNRIEEILSARIDVLQADFDSLSGATTTLDPSGNGFGRLNTDTGRFLIACENVQPYLDGDKVTVKIGNPNAADYHGFTLKVKWGQKEPEFPDSTSEPDDTWQKAHTKRKADDARWQAELQRKEIPFADLLKTGTWHTVEMVLSPVKSGGLGYIEIGMEAPTIGLSKDDSFDR